MYINKQTFTSKCFLYIHCKMWQIVHCCKRQRFARRNQSIFNTNIFSSAINLVSVCVYILYYLFCSFIIQRKVLINASQLERITIEKIERIKQVKLSISCKDCINTSFEFWNDKGKNEISVNYIWRRLEWILCSYIPSQIGCARNALNCDRLWWPSCQVPLLEIPLT